ncbi:hypothetical protein [Enterococcus sp. DIV0187]|uniref:hypothetical protein n=1 Tax=Enterococcus sp. DIV0187 TaxID=2774644 RepID=UPI003F26F11F
MDAEKEVEVIYGLMQEIISERRELSRQYYDLKYRLDDLLMVSGETPFSQNSIIKESISDKKSKKVNVIPRYKRKPKVAFERIAGYVSEILRNSDVPMNSKSIYERLIEDYQINISFESFRSNTLPRIGESNNFSVEKAYRGYWQYVRRNV